MSTPVGISVTRVTSKRRRITSASGREAALIAVHAIGLKLEVRAAQGVGGVLDVAAPDHGFDVVLEKDGMRQVGEIAGGREVIDDGAIEVFLADEIFEEGPHAGRIEALD